MSEESWFHSSSGRSTDQITYLTLIRLARVEICQSVPKTAWEIVGAWAEVYIAPYVVKKKLEDVQQPRHSCDGGLTSRDFRHQVIGDWRRFSAVRATESKKIPISDLWGTLLRFFEGLELFLVFWRHWSGTDPACNALSEYFVLVL